MACTSASSQLVALTAMDGEPTTLIVKRSIADQSITLKHLLADMPDMEDGDDTPMGPIPLPNISASQLEKFIQYCEYYSDKENPMTTVDEATKRTSEMSTWDKEFCYGDASATTLSPPQMEALFKLILAANYLDVKPLLDLGCKAVACLIKGKTPEQLKELFQITRDLTQEEEEILKKENPWLVESR